MAVMPRMECNMYDMDDRLWNPCFLRMNICFSDDVQNKQSSLFGMEIFDDFSQVNSIAIVFFHRRNIGKMKLAPELETPRRIGISDEMTLDLYKDIGPKIEVQKSRIEIHLKKIYNVR
jgi:hypothetical protein